MSARVLFGVGIIILVHLAASREATTLRGADDHAFGAQPGQEFPLLLFRSEWDTKSRPSNLYIRVEGRWRTVSAANKTCLTFRPVRGDRPVPQRRRLAGREDATDAYLFPDSCDDAFRRAGSAAGNGSEWPVVCHPDLRHSSIHGHLAFRLPAAVLIWLGNLTIPERIPDERPTLPPHNDSDGHEEPTVSIPEPADNSSAPPRPINKAAAPICVPDTEGVTHCSPLGEEEGDQPSSDVEPPSPSPPLPLPVLPFPVLPFPVLPFPVPPVSHISVCYRDEEEANGAVDVGPLVFHDPPVVQPPLVGGQRVPVRIFLNPGWELALTIRGQSFSQHNIIALKERMWNCKGFADENVFHAATRPKLAEKYNRQATFGFSQDYRVYHGELKRWRHRFQHMQWFEVCFYADHNQLNGTVAGEVEFLMDHRDAAELVGFIMFAIMGVPFLCGATLACYAFKHRRLRRRHRRVFLVQQQDRIEARLLRALGLPEYEGAEASESGTTNAS
ncbi:unnamed protein product [Vitrella brassicaformis CCMP3155]|uniref:Uncharacterized protein n=1 Tax=Vitrella brassicaformis (strain CCMP3155) TaxID=1169540 RepID=A0A0G4F148_VITBC|nr:unnamed protein product [Vitrella brassicaformis CCMP3155]|eukprot:CEM05422.1 unnamed protein product [Vitrella brassicaformis CCMP3155]